MRALSVIVLLSLAACQEVVIGGRPGQRDTDGPDIDDPRGDDVEIPIAVCQATPNPAKPGEEVDFVGENSRDPDGSELINYRWTLAKKPASSGAALPRGDANLEGFLPDVVGEYVATLVVTDEWGKPSNACAATLNVAPVELLYIEVVASVDDQIRPVLTLGETACKPGDCAVAWGDAAATPSTSEGPGEPSVIAITDPADGEYTLSVVDEISLDGWLSDTEVEVVVWVEGVEKLRTTVMLGLEGKSAPIASVLWPAGKVTPAP